MLSGVGTPLLVFPVGHFRAKAVKLRIWSLFVPCTPVCL